MAVSSTLTVNAPAGGPASATITGTATCITYGLECSSGGLCCQQVPCTSGRCRYP